MPPVAVVRFTLDAAEPITLLFIDATIEVMLVAKESIPLNADRVARDLWGVAGVYVLLGPPSVPDALIRARPGMGRDVLARVREHPSENPWFTRALMARDTRQGWNTAEAGYLEGRLHDLCRDSVGVDHDVRRDHDGTLQDHERTMLDQRYLPPIVATLHLAGVPLDQSLL